MFSGCSVLPVNKETNFGSSNQEDSLSADKNTMVVLGHVADGSVSVHLFLRVWVFPRYAFGSQ